MKTRLTLVAAAVLALPTLAQAQSNVEIYGRIDVGVNVVRTGATATTAKRTDKLVSSDTPWLGFRGTEDLGGGLRAFFKMEHGFNPDTGTQAIPAQFWNREAYVGLGSSSYGNITLGSHYTPALWMTGRIDPFRRSNTGAVFPMFQQPIAGLVGFTPWVGNAIQYTSPLLAGIQAKILVGTSEGLATGGRPLSTSLDYTSGGFFGAVTYDRMRVPGAPVGRPTVPWVDQTTWMLGTTYKFSMLKLHGYYINTDVDGAPGMTGGMVGVSVPVGTGEFAFSAIRRNAEDVANSDGQTLALQYTHFLSKRTWLYVGGAHQSNKGNANHGIWPARMDMGPSPAGADLDGLNIGMRHHF